MTVDSAPAFERRIPFEAIDNFRDLGGYPSRYGGITRSRQVFRSSTLHRATEADRAKLAALGIRRVFDLRSFRELERDGFLDFDGAGILREHTPIFPDLDTSPERLIARYKMYSQDYVSVYMLMLKEGAPTFRCIVETLAGEADPLVFHCSGGKDRAGMTAALLLRLAGVDDATIVEDYVLTASYLSLPGPDRVEQFCSTFAITPEEFIAMFTAEADSMERSLARLDELYPTVEDYLLSIGLGEDTVEAARKRLLEPLSP